MNQQKQQYLNNIRTNTAYPTYRGIIGIIAILGYLFAALNGLGSLLVGFTWIVGLSAMGDSLIYGLGIIIGGALIAGLIFLGVRFWKEAALILADIGDSITDINSQNKQ